MMTVAARATEAYRNELAEYHIESGRHVPLRRLRLVVSSAQA